MEEVKHLERKDCKFGKEVYHPFYGKGWIDENIKSWDKISVRFGNTAFRVDYHHLFLKPVKVCYVE